MRRPPNSFSPFLAGITLALVVPAQAAVTVDIVHGAATVSRLGSESSLNPGDALGERDVVSVPVGSALKLRFGSSDSVELGGDTVIAIERLPDASRPTEGKTILSLDHGVVRVIRPGGDDLVLPFHLFLGDQRAALSEGDFYFEREPRLVQACAESGQLSLPPTEFLPLRVVSGQNCYHNAGGEGPPRVLQHDESFFTQARARIGLLNVPASAMTTVPSVNPATVAVPVSASTPVHAPASVAASGFGGAVLANTEPVPVASASSVPAVTEAVPAALPVEAAPGPTEWTVNLASFSQLEQANDEVQRLQAGGFPAAVESKEVGGVMHYRVQLRGFESADAARSQANEVAARFGYKDYFLIKTP